MDDESRYWSFYCKFWSPSCDSVEVDKIWGSRFQWLIKIDEYNQISRTQILRLSLVRSFLVPRLSPFALPRLILALNHFRALTMLVPTFCFYTTQSVKSDCLSLGLVSHKCQGMSLDYANVHLGGIFDPGQYVLILSFVLVDQSD